MKRFCFLFAFLALFFLLFSASCKSTRKELPAESKGPRVLSWSRIYTGNDLIGFIKKEELARRDDSSNIYHIYDRSFRALGFISNKGRAFRFDKEGNPRLLASSTMENNVKAIIGKDVAIHFEAGLE